jgi:hypothetical protein
MQKLPQRLPVQTYALFASPTTPCIDNLLLHVYICLLLDFAYSLYGRIICFDSNSPSTKSLRSLWLARNDRDPFVSSMNRAR